MVRIRQLLKIDVLKAKVELEKHVSGIRMAPQTGEKKDYYVAEGNWNLLGGYGEEATPAAERIQSIAGACLDAIHNALSGRLVRRWMLSRKGRRSRPGALSRPAG